MATAGCSCQSSLNAACCSSRRAPGRRRRTSQPAPSTSAPDPAAQPGPTGHARSGPGETGQDKPVPVWVRDRDTPLVPVGIAGGDPGAARIDQPADDVLIDVAAYVQDQQVFLGGRGWCRVVRVADEFKMP